MIRTIQLKYILPLVFLTLILISCQDAGKNSTGSEFMPEMAHSIAFEANSYIYYPRNTFSDAEAYHSYVQPRLPVEGTIARGSTLTEAHPYYYGNTEEERARATREIIENPLKITEKSLAVGKELFTFYCAICHGENGDSKGYLVREDGGKYLALPANFLSEDLLQSSNGRYYHALMHGRNVMSAYDDKLDYEERWSVIQYIRSLQAKSKGLEYNHLVNTFNTTDTPGGETRPTEVPAGAMSDQQEQTEETNGEGQH